MDPIEFELQSKLIDAKYNYMKYLREKQMPKFNEQTRDYVWDENHWYYKYIFPTKQNINSNEDDSINYMQNENNDNDDKTNDVLQKKLYIKLSLLCHPDKCNEKWSNDIFRIINDANKKNNVTVLQNIMNYYKKNNSLEGYCDEYIDKESIIIKWQNELWFRWFNGSMIKDVLITQDEFISRVKKLNEALEIEKNNLQKYNDDLKNIMNNKI